MTMIADLAQKGPAMPPPSRFIQKKNRLPQGESRSLSRFMRRTLMPGETVIREGYFHPFYTFMALLTLLACLGTGWSFPPEFVLEATGGADDSVG